MGRQAGLRHPVHSHQRHNIHFSLEATDHADKSTKMTVVVTLWILTSYLMLQVPSVLRWTILSHHHLVETNPRQFEASSSNYNIENISLTAIRGIFSIFSVWHRLTTLFDAEDDPRVPAFQVKFFIIINQIFFRLCHSNNILIINDSDIHINDY